MDAVRERVDHDHGPGVARRPSRRFWRTSARSSSTPGSTCTAPYGRACSTTSSARLKAWHAAIDPVGERKQRAARGSDKGSATRTTERLDKEPRWSDESSERRKRAREEALDEAEQGTGRGGQRLSAPVRSVSAEVWGGARGTRGRAMPPNWPPHSSELRSELLRGRGLLGRVLEHRAVSRGDAGGARRPRWSRCAADRLDFPPVVTLLGALSRSSRPWRPASRPSTGWTRERLDRSSRPTARRRS